MTSVYKTTLGKVLFIAEDTDLTRVLQNAFKNTDFTFLTTSMISAPGILENNHIDMIIYDFKLSEFDHFELLKTIKNDFPDVIRIILGGYVDQPAVVKALTNGLAMSFFTKPKDANATELKGGILRMLSIRKILKGKQLLNLMNSIERLPHLPLLYQEFMKAIEDNARYEDFADIISKDVSVATSVLHVTNSAFYGSQGTASLEHAIMYLGVETVRNIVLAVSLANLKPLSDMQMIHFQKIIRHSSFVNKYMQLLFKQIHGRPIDNNLKSAGLTHDIGKIVLLQFFPNRYKSIIKRCEENTDLSFFESELTLGFNESTHSEVGAFLLDLWNLPEVSIEIALFHHNVERQKCRVPDVVETTHLANELVNFVEKGKNIKTVDCSMFQFGHLIKDNFSNLIQSISSDHRKD
ncbi:HDOD domain-containing protein [candidate division KSB1 bacterium]|nr:HDOD domain-containing protein [candidate division KSB1 bacterium]